MSRFPLNRVRMVENVPDSSASLKIAVRVVATVRAVVSESRTISMKTSHDNYCSANYLNKN